MNYLSGGFSKYYSRKSKLEKQEAHAEEHIVEGLAAKGKKVISIRTIVMNCLSKLVNISCLCCCKLFNSNVVLIL